MFISKIARKTCARPAQGCARKIGSRKVRARCVRARKSVCARPAQGLRKMRRNLKQPAQGSLKNVFAQGLRAQGGAKCARTLDRRFNGIHGRFTDASQTLHRCFTISFTKASQMFQWDSRTLHRRFTDASQVLTIGFPEASQMFQ